MLVMAVEGLEKLLQVGDDSACRLANCTKIDDPKCGPNTHASKMDLIKLEECEKHEASSISKRVGKMLKTHFVSCAICKERYPARTPNTKFCDECKCMVCAKCNCEVYHLSFQLAQWDGVDAEEKKKESSKVARNKKKRQKKKSKKKQRNDKKSKKSSNNNNSLYAEDHEEEARKSRSPTLSPSKGPAHPPAAHGIGMMSLPLDNTVVASGGGRSRKRGGNGRSMGSSSMGSSSMGRQVTNTFSVNHSSNTNSSSTTNLNANARGPVHGGKKMNAKGRSNNHDHSDTKKESNVVASSDTKKTKTKTKNDGKKKEAPKPLLRASSADMEENDKLVSFFEQSGSILDLANFLDENGEDDGMSAQELAELQREMQAMKT